MASWFKEESFQEKLLSFLCRDRNFLKKCGGLLSPNDFKPGSDESDERWIVATEALEFWHKYREPIGGLLRVKIVEFCKDNNRSDKQRKVIISLVDKIIKGERLIAVEAMEDRVLAYLRSRMMKHALEELIDKKQNNELSPETFVEVCRNVAKWSGKSRRRVSEVLSSKDLEARILRRAYESTKKRPLLLIEDFDLRSKGPGRGDLGLVVGPYKKGKSLMLAHIADAYAKQKLNVLYYTLEDPIEEVEDRMDASLAYMPIEKLHELPDKLRKRFKKFSRLISGRIKIVDCTAGGMTIRELEEIWEQQRDEGFEADVTIADYDKELVTAKKHRERRFEFEEIYTDYRQFCSRRDVIGWTAAQSKRLKDSHKVVTSDKIGEDIGKIQKCTIAFGIGQGEYHEDSRHIFTMANKRGRQHFGFDIMCNPRKGLFYDLEKTIEMKRKLLSKARRGEDGD